MRGRGLKVSGNIRVLIRTTAVLPSRRIEGSPRRVGSHRDTDPAAQDARRGRGEPSGGCGQEEGTHGGPGAEPSAFPGSAEGQPGWAGRDGTGRERSPTAPGSPPSLLRRGDRAHSPTSSSPRHELIQLFNARRVNPCKH